MIPANLILAEVAAAEWNNERDLKQKTAYHSTGKRFFTFLEKQVEAINEIKDTNSSNNKAEVPHRFLL